MPKKDYRTIKYPYLANVWKIHTVNTHLFANYTEMKLEVRNENLTVQELKNHANGRSPLFFYCSSLRSWLSYKSNQERHQV